MGCRFTSMGVFKTKDQSGFNLLSDYFQNQLNIINDNIHDRYTYLFLAILIKIWRAYINGQSN